ncbi:unnamed protein product [Vicia faba]|uniref:Uncharacterized protein n=1 Tax=Vicia faba TaxID=3906 RepID=A0AAV1A0P2_VICFA|nr:unnamed protein product [Vicia faba]
MIFLLMAWMKMQVHRSESYMPSLQNYGQLVTWTTMGSNVEFAGQKRGAEHYTQKIRAAYIKKIPRCDISKQLRNKIIGHSLKNLSNEEINMKKWWLRYKPDMGTLHLWKCYCVRLQCLDPECRISRLRRVSLVIGGLLRDLHCNPVLELRLLAVLFRGYRSGCGYVVKVTFAVFGC